MNQMFWNDKCFHFTSIRRGLSIKLGTRRALHFLMITFKYSVILYRSTYVHRNVIYLYIIIVCSSVTYLLMNLRSQKSAFYCSISLNGEKNWNAVLDKYMMCLTNCIHNLFVIRYLKGIKELVIKILFYRYLKKGNEFLNT